MIVPSVLKKILIGLVAVVILLVVVVATRPAAFHVERKLEVAASPEVVFGVLSDIRQFAGVMVMFGEPWETADPNMQKTIEGQSYAWSGNMQVGTGKMTIEESVPSEKVTIRLDFEKPMKSTAMFRLTLAPAPAGSVVTWSMDGTHNFLGKAFGLFMDTNSMLAADLDAGLARVKTAAEAKQAEVASSGAER